MVCCRIIIDDFSCGIAAPTMTQNGRKLYNYEKKEISLFNAQLPVIRDFQLKIHDQ